MPVAYALRSDHNNCTNLSWRFINRCSSLARNNYSHILTIISDLDALRSDRQPKSHVICRICTANICYCPADAMASCAT